MADRQLKVLPTAISLLVTFQSAISLLGLTAEVYCYGIQYLIFSVIATMLGVIIVDRVIIPWLYPLKLVSIFEYLERRYMSKSIRIFGSSMGILTWILVTGVVMYAPSAALESATGLPLKVSLPVMGVVTIVYTALGGMRAVIWTDVFQFLIMISGIVAVLVKGVIVVGGFSNVFRLAGQEGRLFLANINPDMRERHTVWGLLIGLTISWASGYGLSQASVQRYSAVNSLKNARITVLINLPSQIVMSCMYSFIGLVVLAYYSTIKCDPLANRNIHNSNQLLPYFIVTIFSDSPGFGGLFLATLYGASLSTISSSLSAASANIWEDILSWKLDKMSESRKALISRSLVVLLGVLVTGIAFLAASIPGPILQVTMALCSSVTGPWLAPLILGGITRRTNWKGCLIGGLIGLTFGLWLTVGSMTVPHSHPPLHPVSTEGCSSGNSTTFNSSLPEGNASFLVSREISVGSWNDTLYYLPRNESLPRHTPELRGLENFYAISYVWFVPLGIIVTGLFCVIASLLLRDKELEEKIDDRLLISFRNCGWRDNTTDQKDYLKANGALDEKNKEIYDLLMYDNNNHDKKPEVISSTEIDESAFLSIQNGKITNS